LKIKCRKHLKSQEPRDEDNIYWFFANEHSQHNEFLKCIDFFENKEITKEFDVSNYTPIKCCKTNVLLKIGDKVEKEEHGNKRCGILYWDELFNEYLIKSGDNGHFRFRYISKIEELYDYTIDTTGVECRRAPYRNR
jgi:hypothetical protein